MKRWTSWLIGLVLLMLVAAGVWRGVQTQRAKQQALQAVEQRKAEARYQINAAEVVVAQQRPLPLSLPISGTVEAVHTATIKARVAGEIQDLRLREGDSVQAGQVVARIDSTESQARLAQARQQADAAKAQRDIQQRQFDNNQALVNQGFISATALEASRSQLQAAQSNHQAALSAAAVLQKNLADTVLRSPISGQVAKKHASNGEKVGPDAAVLDVVDLSQLELLAQLPPADSLQVRTGQRATLQVEGSPERVEAEVVRVNPSAASASRSVPVYLRLAASAHSGNGPVLRQGLYLQGLLQTGSLAALAIPLSAVRTDKPEPYVQLLRPQADSWQVVHQPVQLGQRVLLNSTAWVAVQQGLADGDKLLSGSVGQMREGTLLQIRPEAPPAAAPGGDPAAKALP